MKELFGEGPHPQRWWPMNCDHRGFPAEEARITAATGGWLGFQIAGPIPAGAELPDLG